MITYKFFMDNFGLSETEAKDKMNKITDSKFSSISGIVRLFDSTLLQKINFYQTEFGYSLDEIFEDLRLLNYDTTTEPTQEELKSQNMDKKKKTCVRAKAYYLRDVLGLTDEQLRSMSLFSYDTDTLKQQVKDLKKFFGLEIPHIQECPSLLYNDIETLKQKAEFYKKELGYTSKQFKDFPKLFNYDCDPESTSPTSAIQKINFYRNELGLKDNQLRSYPVLLSYDTASNASKEKSVKYKMKVYAELLGFTKREFQKCPSLLNHDCISGEDDPSSVRGKIKVYREFLGFEDADFFVDPGVFSYDCSDSGSLTSVKKKVAFYENNIGLTKEHIRKNPILLHFDCDPESTSPTSVAKKLEAIYKIGLTNEDIQANTKLLMTPAEDLEEKYVLWSTIFPDKRYMELLTWFITRPEKIYARYKYLTEELHHPALRPNHLDHCESQFIKRFKSDSASLMERYPYDEAAKKEIYSKYKGLEIEPPIEYGK